MSNNYEPKDLKDLMFGVGAGIFFLRYRFQIAIFIDLGQLLVPLRFHFGGV